MPPNLETFIPGECLPDVIDVYIGDDLFNDEICPQYLAPGKWFTMRQPIKFVRQYPPLCIPAAPADEGTFNTRP